MNEIKHIHLGRTSFTVSVEAHKELHEYLQAIKHQAGASGAEVVNEVEARMAELLAERKITGDKVVLPADVKYLKEQLGEPHEFKEDVDEGVSPAAAAGDTTKRLFRDTDNAMVAGVASGLAAYLGIDPIILRLLFIVVTFFGGSGILIYIILWLLVPEAKTTSERLSMQGKAATIDNLKQVVERADLPGAARRGGTIVARILTVIGRIVLLIVGLPLAIGSGVALLGIMVMGGYILMDGFKVAGHVVAPIGGHEVLGFVAGVITLICIFLFMMLVGIAMVRRRWQLPAWGVAAILGIFFLSAVVGGALAADVEPTIRNRVETLEHTRTVQLASFGNVTLSGPETNFTYIPDGKNYIRYHYFGSVNTAKLQNTVKGGKLTVNTAGADPYICNNFCPGVDPGITVEVHGPKTATVTVNGKPADVTSRQSCTIRDFGEPKLISCPVVPDRAVKPAPVPTAP